MTVTEVFAVLGVLITLGCQILYFWAIYKKRARPHVFTYFNWGLMTAIGTFAQLELGGGDSIWVMGATAAGYFSTALLAVFVGEKNITKSDCVAFATALGAIAMWQMGANPLYAVGLVAFIDVATYYPTVRKSWHDPWGEPVAPYLIASSRYMLAALAVDDKVIESILAPIFLGSTDFLFAFYLMWRQRVIPNPRAI